MAEGRRDPQPGDLIEIFRPGYQHWALYVGQDYVIHVTDVALTGTATVKKERLKDVVGKQNWRVNNTYDQDHTPRPVKEIIQDAESFVGIRFQYNLMTNNCEHFVTLLRYDEKFSKQVKDAVICAGVGASVVAISAIIMSAWKTFSEKKKSGGISFKQAGVRNYKGEFPVEHNEKVPEPAYVTYDTSYQTFYK